MHININDRNLVSVFKVSVKMISLIKMSNTKVLNNGINGVEEKLMIGDDFQKKGSGLGIR